MGIDYKKFFEASFDLFCVVGPTHFVEVNNAWHTVLGYDREELLGRPWADFVHPDDLQRSLKAFGAFTGSPFVNRYFSKDGKIVFLEWTAPPQDGENFYAVARDVTSRKMVEEQLGKYVLQLRKKAEELQRSNRDLEQFAYVASHDLQTPLRKVKNFTMLLQQEYGHLLDDPVAQKYMNLIVAGAEKSQELIDGLLSFSRTGRDIKHEALPLDVPLEDALSILNDFIEKRGVEIRKGPMPEVIGDRMLLTRVFQNLIGNAVKFRDQHKDPMWVRVWAEERESSWEISVQDNGVGFDPRHAERIFVIFQRLAGRKNGAGLGLALCKKIVERHGGTIWAESTPKEGSQLVFTLPKKYRNGHGYPSSPPTR